MKLLSIFICFYLPSDIFCSRDKSWASFCCLSASSPRPLKSTRNNAMMESTICRQGCKTLSLLQIHSTEYCHPWVRYIRPTFPVRFADWAGINWFTTITWFSLFLANGWLKPFGHTGFAYILHNILYCPSHADIPTSRECLHVITKNPACLHT